MNILNKSQRQVVCVDNEVHSTTFPGFEAAPLLTVGEKYTVINVDVHSYHTLVVLKEFPGEEFNSVLFEEID